VLACLFGGLAVLVGFVFVELHSNDPMFHLDLFKSRSFAMGNLAGLMLAMARGGLQFILIIWLQGIWLPLHGYSFSRTPLWAGIYMVPLTVGFFLSGPLSGRLADRHGPRPFATIGLILTGASLIGLTLLPMNFSYPIFAFLILMVGFSMGMFAAPNTSAVMNSLPDHQRGAGSGMLNTFQNSAAVLSIGFFFTVITIGLASRLPQALVKGLTAQGVSHAAAAAASHVPPIGSLFSAFLGINPLKEIVSASALSAHGVHTSVLLSRAFFPSLISGPFGHGLRLAFLLAAAVCFIGAVFSWLRGAGQSQVFHTMSDNIEEGLSAAGEIAMSDVGAGSTGVFLDDEDELTDASDAAR
jgi:MFS family permease